MKRPQLFLAAVAAAAASALAACSGEPPETPPAGGGDSELFVTSVKPILEANCVGCHHSGSLLGDLNLESAARALTPGPKGAFIVPGQPGASLLYIVLDLDREDTNAMPPDRHRLPANQRRTIHDWIEAGAPWPDGEAGRLRPMADPVPTS